MGSDVQTLQSFDQTAEQTQNQIMCSKLRPNDKLTSEHELVKHFDLRQRAARDAVKALLEVELEPNTDRSIKDKPTTFRAIQVLWDLIIKTGLSDGLTNLIQMRMILEPGIAAIAVETATNEDVEAIQQALAKMDGAHDDAKAFIYADRAFHLALAKATQNSLAIMLLDLVLSLLTDQSGQTYSVDTDVRKAQNHHKRILDAVIQRNPDATRQAMTDHLKQVLEDAENS